MRSKTPESPPTPTKKIYRPPSTDLQIRWIDPEANRQPQAKSRSLGLAGLRTQIVHRASPSGSSRTEGPEITWRSRSREARNTRRTTEYMRFSIWSLRSTFSVQCHSDKRSRRNVKKIPEPLRLFLTDRALRGQDFRHSPPRSKHFRQRDGLESPL